MTSLHYVSTRGEAAGLAFSDVMLAGLARDGGLYVPQIWPQFDTKAWRALAPEPYQSVALTVMRPFIDDAFDSATLLQIIGEAYAGFRHKAITPLIEIARDTWLLELFHGPTFAFKDLALQILGRLIERALARSGAKLTLIGATSGDTGSAAIEAFKERDGIDIFILHPHHRVSEIQRRQMTCVQASNVFNIAIEGTFDDAQAIVKALFQDLSFRDRYRLAGVNSINWARILGQIPYYVAAATALGAPTRPIAFSVPTGNFGDVYAGYAALRMGLPIAQLMIATNENDILARCLASGRYERGPVRVTQSPSMDIQISSNFERLLFELYGRAAPPVRALMQSLEQSGGFHLAGEPLERLRGTFSACRVDEDATSQTIARVYAESGIVIDPHSAVGVAAAQTLPREAGAPVVCLATAHPAKFSEAVARAIGQKPELPAALAQLRDRPEHYAVLASDTATVKRFITERSRAASA